MLATTPPSNLARMTTITTQDNSSAQPANERLVTLLAAQKRGLEMMLENAPLTVVLEHLARTVETLAKGEVVASILLLDDSGALQRGAAPSLPEHYQQAIDGLIAKPGVGTCAAAAATGTIVITRDFNADPCWDGLRHLPLELGLVAAWSLPIKARDHSVLGTFGTYFRECREPFPHEIEAVEILASTAAIAIERERSEIARRDIESDFRTMTDNIPQLAWMANQHGQPLWLNRRWMEYTGHSMEFLRSEGRLTLMHPDHRERALPNRDACIAAGEPWEDMYPLLGKDGNYRWFLTRFVPVRDAAGNIMRWFGTNTDVTDVREAQEALREAGRRKDQFLAVLAHELRNPLAPLVNALEIMPLKYDDRLVLQSLHEMMQRQAAHMVHLVDDLMEVSRISRGKIELRKETVDLRAVLQNAVETSRPLINAAHHRLHIAMPGERISVEGDSVRLTQVFTNLLNNAARYTPDGGEIRLIAAVVDRQVEVSVSDSGRGIAEQQLPVIFDLFFQGETRASAGSAGLGVGLSLARELVQLHEGTIEACSAGVGLGAQFIVTLPLARASSRSAASTARVAAQLSFRILIVDDNRDAADSLAMLLRYCGADTEVVYDGRSALEAIERNTPEIILLDLGMPDMDGYETAQRIRAQEKFAAITLIALTGWSQEDMRARTAAVGFDAHLVKPIEFENLRATLLRLRVRADAHQPIDIHSRRSLK